MNAVKKVEATTTKPQEKGKKEAETAMKVVKPEPVKVPRFMASERLEKLDLFNGLADKRRAYKNKLQELEKFIVGRDEFGYSIVLRNPNQQNVEIKRLDVCEEVIELLKNKVENSLSDVEIEIEKFEI